MFQPVALQGRVCDQCQVAGTRGALIAAIVREAHMSVRVPQDIFSHHIDAVSRGDMVAILKDYSPDAVLLTPQGALEGHSGVIGVVPEQAFGDHGARVSCRVAG